MVIWLLVCITTFDSDIVKVNDGTLKLKVRLWYLCGLNTGPLQLSIGAGQGEAWDWYC